MTFAIIGIICFMLFLLSLVFNVQVIINKEVYLIIGNICLVINRIKIGGMK